MIIFGVYWVKNILLKVIVLVSFYLFNVATRKLKTTYMACIGGSHLISVGQHSPKYWIKAPEMSFLTPSKVAIMSL